MKDEYDLSKMKSRKNPYAAKLKKPDTMRLSEDVIGCFKQRKITTLFGELPQDANYDYKKGRK